MLRRSAIAAGKMAAQQLPANMSRSDYAAYLCENFGICAEDKVDGPPLASPPQDPEESSLVWRLFSQDIPSDAADPSAGSTQGRWMYLENGWWKSSADNLFEYEDDPPLPDYDPVATNLYEEGQVPSEWIDTGTTHPYDPPS